MSVIIGLLWYVGLPTLAVVTCLYTFMFVCARIDARRAKQAGLTRYTRMLIRGDEDL